MRILVAGNRDMAPTLFTLCNTLPPGGAELARGGPSRRSLAPTLFTSSNTLPPEGAELARGGPSRRSLAHRGFTLLELLVVLAIMAMATAGVSLTLRDNSQTTLEREAQRLAALFESARAQSRASGVPVLWRPTPGGFGFEGLPPSALPGQWLDPGTTVRGTPTVQLGPEPIVGAQTVELFNRDMPQSVLRVTTDGLRPFAVQLQP